MHTMRRLRLLAPLLVALSLAAAPVAARADSEVAVTGITPAAVVLNGQPIRLTLTGYGLSQVTAVNLSPVLLQRSFVALSDNAILLSLPADTPPGDYTVQVSTPNGGSDPAQTPAFAVRTAPSAIDLGPPPPPRYSFAPYPTPQSAEPQTGVIAPGVSVSHPDPPSPQPLNPLVLLPLGIVVGGLGYLLWGRPGRLAAADRQGLLAHLVGRPVQALNIGRICLQCGRFHFVLRTRRDLWRAGQFCSATCFVGAQEEDSAARAGESTAVTRMREMFVYSELEQNLQAALAGDVHALEHAAAIGDPSIEAVLAPPA